MASKRTRQQLLRSILASERVPSQEALLSRLAASGVQITQGTLSKDLRELGVLKGAGGYMLAESTMAGSRAGAMGEQGLNAGAAAALSRAVSEFVLDAKAAGNLAVLKTGPGQASALALEIDRAGLPSAVGTIAGDDTVFIAATTARRAASLVASLVRLAPTRNASTPARAGANMHGQGAAAR